jgi:membrane protein insertase Oxa1/YidC/SpoIIIJ
VSQPENINMNFLGLINITGKSLLLALLAGVSSFFQIRLSVPAITPSQSNTPAFQNDFARSMNLQMRYFFPIIVFFISYSISGVVALYWFTSNIFTIIQEKYVRRKLEAKA